MPSTSLNIGVKKFIFLLILVNLFIFGLLYKISDQKKFLPTVLTQFKSEKWFEERKEKQ